MRGNREADEDDGATADGSSHSPAIFSSSFWGYDLCQEPHWWRQEAKAKATVVGREMEEGRGGGLGFEFNFVTLLKFLVIKDNLIDREQLHISSTTSR